MENGDKILAQLEELSRRLYGQTGSEGDIPHIRYKLTTMNELLINHERRLTGLEIKTKLAWPILISIAASGGTVAGVLKLAGLY